MAESFKPRSFPKPEPTVIVIDGDMDLTGYSVDTVEFLPQGATSPISWSFSGFHVKQGQPTHATLNSTPSTHSREKLDPVSGTLTISLSSGSQEEEGLSISETVTVGQ